MDIRELFTAPPDVATLPKIHIIYGLLAAAYLSTYTPFTHPQTLCTHPPTHTDTHTHTTEHTFSIHDEPVYPASKQGQRWQTTIGYFQCQAHSVPVTDKEVMSSSTIIFRQLEHNVVIVTGKYMHVSEAFCNDMVRKFLVMQTTLIKHESKTGVVKQGRIAWRQYMQMVTATQELQGPSIAVGLYTNREHAWKNKASPRRKK